MQIKAQGDVSTFVETCCCPSFAYFGCASHLLYVTGGKKASIQVAPVFLHSQLLCPRFAPHLEASLKMACLDWCHRQQGRGDESSPSTAFNLRLHCAGLGLGWLYNGWNDLTHPPLHPKELHSSLFASCSAVCGDTRPLGEINVVFKAWIVCFVYQNYISGQVETLFLFLADCFFTSLQEVQRYISWRRV